MVADTRVAATISLFSALIVAAPTALADPPAPVPTPVLKPLALGEVTRIGPVAGTGTPTADYGIGATDLCEFMEFPSGILQICGDSFAGQGVGFGGWYAPVEALAFIPGAIWLILKITLCMFVFIWARATFPRYRYDQLMRLGWKVFLPLSLLWVVATAAWKVFA